MNEYLSFAFMLIPVLFVTVRYMQVMQRIALEKKENLLNYIHTYIHSDNHSDELKERLLFSYSIANRQVLGLSMFVVIVLLPILALIKKNNQVRLTKKEREINNEATRLTLITNFYAGMHWYILALPIFIVYLVLFILLMGTSGLIDKALKASEKDVDYLYRHHGMKLG